MSLPENSPTSEVVRIAMRTTAPTAMAVSSVTVIVP